MNVSGVFDVASLPPPQVSCPFQTYLSAGKHTFKVAIPKQFLSCPHKNQELKRKFYFSHLRLVPDFYNRDAYLFKFDTAEDLNLKLDYDFGLFYDVDADLYPSVLDFPKQDTEGLQIFFNDVNRWSITVKPTNTVKPPFVVDWVDLELEAELLERQAPANTTPEIIRAFMEGKAFDYYGEELSDDKHANRLSSSLKTIPYVNSFLFPTMAGENSDVLENLRVRIAVAPNTKLSFSSKRQLQTLGFAADRRVGHRFEFVNRNSQHYEYFVADTYPEVAVKMETGKLHVNPAALGYYATRTLGFSLKEKRDNELFQAALQKYLDQMSKETNIDFSISYNKVTGLFAFQWPNNPKIAVKVVADAELFERLGFGLVTEIDKSNVATRFVVGDKESAAKSKVLCFDTGHVVVTCPNTSSNLTSVSNNQYLASLFPMGAGILEMPPPQSDVSFVVPPSFEGGDSVHLKCHLWKFDDAGHMVPFQWLTGSVVSGVLRGKI